MKEKAKGKAVANIPGIRKKRTAAAEVPVRDRIIQASYKCFERYGVAKTTMEDVAKLADCSRQTVYKNFASKDELVTEICVLESIKMNEQIRARVKARQSFADKLIDSVLIAVEIGLENPYVRRLIEPAEVQSRSTQKDDPVHAAQRERWQPLLEGAMDSGELSPDLDIDEVVSWLTLVQMAVIVKCEGSPMSQSQLKRLVSRFIVAPLLVGKSKKS